MEHGLPLTFLRSCHAGLRPVMSQFAGHHLTVHDDRRVLERQSFARKMQRPPLIPNDDAAAEKSVAPASLWERLRICE